MEGKEKKHDKNELVIKLDCIKKAKDFPFTLTCKRGKIKSSVRRRNMIFTRRKIFSSRTNNI